jgi:hypothetical protein
MSHLPPGFGVPDGPLSVDHLMAMWVLLQLALLILVAVALWLVPLRNADATGDASRRAAPARPARLKLVHPVRRLAGRSPVPLRPRRAAMRRTIESAATFPK